MNIPLMYILNPFFGIRAPLDRVPFQKVGLKSEKPERSL